MDFVQYFNHIAFAFFAFAVFAALYKERRFAGAELAGPRHEKLWLALLIILGLGLRLWAFGDMPGGINQDGAMAAVDGKALADYGTDRFGTKLPAHLYAWGYGQMSSLLSYLIALFVKLFGLSTVTARLPQLLASIMGGICFYLFVRDSFGRRAGLLAAFLAAINPWHLMQSRWALDCNLLPHFFMAGLCFLKLGLDKRRAFIYLSMLFFGLCMYCYGIAIYTVCPFLLCTGLYLVIKKQLRAAELLACAGIWLLVSWPFVLTMAINYFEWETIALPFVTMQRFYGSVRAGDILFFSENIPAQFAANLKSFVNVVILQKKDLPWNDMQGFGTVYLFTLPLAAAGIYRLIRSRGTGKSLTFAGLFTGVFMGLATNNVNVNRVNLVFYFVLLLIVLGLDFVLANAGKLRLPSLAVFAAAGVLMANCYFTNYAESIRGYFFYGFEEALDMAQESGAEHIYVTADAQYEGYWNVSEIITLFYDETDALYFQGKSNINHGRELLPYSQRFGYMSFDENTVLRAPESTAFVGLASDAVFFPEESYAVTAFGGFICAVEK